jgi:hypothetical protein
LSGEDLFQDRVGVLCFVEEEKVGVDPWFGQGPHLQVVVMLETDHTLLGVLQVSPCLVGKWQDDLGEPGVLVRPTQAAQRGYVVRSHRAVSRVAETGHRAQEGV